MKEFSSSLGRYKVLSSCELSQNQGRDLLDLLSAKPELRGGVLTGRGGVAYGSIDGLGPVVAKYYLRGGLLRRLVRRHYLSWGENRAVQELRLLSEVRSLGVNAPLPVAACWRGSILYQAWLVTQEIQAPLSLAELAADNAADLMELVNALGQQVALLIDGGILHVDLHPGNVLVDSARKVYILDFDKALRIDRGVAWLRDQYIFRWRRAIIKHRLPEMLAESFCAILRQIR